jgi:hypothetical protein
MSKFAALILFVFCFVLCDTVSAQNAQARTDSLIAALAKTKYKKKEKRNVSIEVYIDIQSEAVLKASPQEYSGVYQTEGYRLELRVGADGKAEGNGFDSPFVSGQNVNFKLKDARVEGALLTATKVFDNGETEKLEAVFNNRTVTTGKNPNEIENRETLYGIGFIQSYSGSEMTNRIFLEFKVKL